MSISSNIGNILGYDAAERDKYFTILGCSENSTDEQINTEYKIRALKCHPDKNPGNESALQEFQMLQEARDTLTNPEMRRTYDKWRGSEMCIPFKTWLSMSSRCTTTMHWAKPKEQTMLEARSDDSRSYQNSTDGSRNSGDDEILGISRSTRGVWESDRDSSSSVYQQFRNYKI